MQFKSNKVTDTLRNVLKIKIKLYKGSLTDFGKHFSSNYKSNITKFNFFVFFRFHHVAAVIEKFSHNKYITNTITCQ